MRIVFECGICGRRFYSSLECETHEESCIKNRITHDERQRLISEMSTSIINTLIENPKEIIDGVVNYLRDINGDATGEDMIDITDYGFESFFELLAEINEEYLHEDISINDVKQKCLFDFQNYLFKSNY